MFTAGSKFFSFVFHPLLLPSYAFLFINYSYPYLLAGLKPDDKVKIFATLFINTFIFPVITIGIMRKLNFISSFHLRDREERVVPIIAISIFYFWTFMVIKNLDIGTFFSAIILGASLSVFMTFFFNLFFKISIHSVGAGNFVAVAILLAFNSRFNLELPLILSVIIAGILGSSRLFLKEHKPIEVYFGYAVGVLGQIFAFIIL